MDEEGAIMNNEGASSSDEGSINEGASSSDEGSITNDNVVSSRYPSGPSASTSILYKGENHFLTLPFQDIEKGLIENDIYSVLDHEISLLQEMVGEKQLRTLKEQTYKLRVLLINLRREIVDSNVRHYPESTERVFQILAEGDPEGHPQQPVGCWKVYLKPRDRGELRPCPGCHQLGVLRTECSGCIETHRCDVCQEIGPRGEICGSCFPDYAGDPLAVHGRHVDPLKFGDTCYYDKERFVVDFMRNYVEEADNVEQDREAEGEDEED